MDIQKPPKDCTRDLDLTSYISRWTGSPYLAKLQDNVISLFNDNNIVCLKNFSGHILMYSVRSWCLHFWDLRRPCLEAGLYETFRSTSGPSFSSVGLFQATPQWSSFLFIPIISTIRCFPCNLCVAGHLNLTRKGGSDVAGGDASAGGGLGRSQPYGWLDDRPLRVSNSSSLEGNTGLLRQSILLR